MTIVFVLYVLYAVYQDYQINSKQSILHLKLYDFHCNPQTDEDYNDQCLTW
jgi:hypothetical protein